MNNCAARFDWCVAPRSKANHHPLAAIDGDETDAFIYRDVVPGRTLRFDASASSDPDGDPLIFRWYFYPEAGSYSCDFPPVIADDQGKCSVHIPRDAAGKELHLILEVVDKSEIVPLTDYRRVVIRVRDD